MSSGRKWTRKNRTPKILSQALLPPPIISHQHRGGRDWSVSHFSATLRPLVCNRASTPSTFSCLKIRHLPRTLPASHSQMPLPAVRVLASHKTSPYRSYWLHFSWQTDTEVEFETKAGVPNIWSAFKGRNKRDIDIGWMLFPWSGPPGVCTANVH